jgi:hypothetical protein
MSWGEIMKKKILTLMLLYLILCLPSIVSATLSDDGYHFSDYYESPNVSDYGEWWYFNFVQEDIQAVIQYSLWDPAQTTEISYGLIYLSISCEGETLDVFFPIPWDYITTSESSADLVMGPNTITVSDESYILQGYVEGLQGNTVSWDLQYIQTVQSFEVETINMSPDPNEEMNWYTQMPSATVLGVLTVNQNTIQIDATGYHDHNWGPWKLYNGLWNWFQTSNQNLAVVGYDFYSLGRGSITVLLDGDKITFEEGTYEIINYDWEFNPEALQLYPTKTQVIAQSRGYSLILNIAVKQTGLVQRYYENEGLVWTVFESTALFKGFLVGRGLFAPVNTQGFKEYTTSILVPPMGA